jgi:hypothetical protein
MGGSASSSSTALYFFDGLQTITQIYGPTLLTGITYSSGVLPNPVIFNVNLVATGVYGDPSSTNSLPQGYNTAGAYTINANVSVSGYFAFVRYS